MRCQSPRKGCETGNKRERAADSQERKRESCVAGFLVKFVRIRGHFLFGKALYELHHAAQRDS